VTSDQERASVLDRMIGRYYPGHQSGQDCDPMPNAHLQTTVLVTMNSEEVTAKVRPGGPKGPRDADPLASGTAGVLELPCIQLPLPR
ncbi:MAG: hypothetical protein ACREJC_14505, partial [Tepidisphaeraceae bacterium]